MALFHILLKSLELKVTTPVNVILPERNGAPADQKYPVLWLLHGATGNHADWTRHSRIEQHVSEMNLAVVMPDGGDSAYADMAVGGRMARYQSYIVRELRGYLTRVLPLSDLREDNFVAGLSMGGQGAVRIGLAHPDRYAAAACLSAGNAIDYYDGDRDQPGDHRLLKIFGASDPASLRGTPADLFYLMKQAVNRGAPLPRIYIACGTEDPLYPLAQALQRGFRALPFDLTWREGPGAHDWAFWDLWIQDVLRWLPLLR
jgi:S-formylglutathione hydrolase FrmB